MTRAKAARGRIDKRRAILDAAFTVFARRGYNQACVQEIADEAEVAKPTVYNHLDDKETLFRYAVEAAADAVAARCVEAIAGLRDPGADLPAALTDSAHRLLRVCASDHSRALRSLTYAQLTTFPDLADTVQDRTSRHLAEALSDRFARLMLSGRLRATDPALAAEHFLALLTGPLEAHSRLGTRNVPAAELRELAESAVDTFVRAYATAENTER
ncbi:TetR/AcrR family transcriptional regulator [Nocardia xishanensis]|uniref:TetR/AcrR family transcriptional regulator n=1 Tax=Nocardia xishanensis TaxID=238964 RepID=UPI00340160DA